MPFRPQPADIAGGIGRGSYSRIAPLSGGIAGIPEMRNWEDEQQAAPRDQRATRMSRGNCPTPNRN